MYYLLMKYIKMDKDKDNEDSLISPEKARKAGKMLYGIICFT